MLFLIAAVVQSLFVLDTDHENYALLYTCDNINVGGEEKRRGKVVLGFRSQMAKNGTLIDSSCLSVRPYVTATFLRSLKNYTVEIWYVDVFCKPH